MFRLCRLLQTTKRTRRIVLHDAKPELKRQPQREAPSRKPTQTVVLNHLDETVEWAPSVSFNGQQLWNATTVAREKRDVRQQQKVFVVGGESAIKRMWLQYHMRPNVVYVPDTLPEVPAWCFASDQPSVVVRCSPIDINKQLLSAEHNDGFAAEFPMPTMPLTQDLLEAPGERNVRLSSCLYLHKILIPSNVGALIRMASDSGMDGVILNQCADPFSEKVARASDGTVANPKLKVYRLDGQTPAAAVDMVQQACTQHQMLPVFAVPSQEAEPFFPVAKRFHTLNASKPSGSQKLGVLLALGSEARGLDDFVEQWATHTPYQPVTIPMQNDQITSMNVAAAGSILINYFAPHAEAQFRELQSIHQRLHLEKQSLQQLSSSTRPSSQN